MEPGKKRIFSLSLSLYLEKKTRVVSRGYLIVSNAFVLLLPPPTASVFSLPGIIYASLSGNPFCFTTGEIQISRECGSFKISGCGRHETKGPRRAHIFKCAHGPRRTHGKLPVHRRTPLKKRNEKKSTPARRCEWSAGNERGPRGLTPGHLSTCRSFAGTPISSAAVYLTVPPTPTEDGLIAAPGTLAGLFTRSPRRSRKRAGRRGERQLTKAARLRAVHLSGLSSRSAGTSRKLCLE